MIIYNEEGSGLGRPKKKKKHITFKRALKKNLTVKNIARATFAPQLLLVPKKKVHSRKAPIAVKMAVSRQPIAVQKTVTPVKIVISEPQGEQQPQAEPEIEQQAEPEPQAEPEAEQEPQVQPEAEQEEGGDDLGLGKSKLLRKINLKGTLKAVKFAAPLMSMIPVVGGPASKLMDTQLGRFATKTANSKAGKAAKALSKTKMGKQFISSAKARLLSDNPQADADAGTETETPPDKLGQKPKDNTLLYVGIGAALIGMAYVATRKK
jgi:hypothetical protein